MAHKFLIVDAGIIPEVFVKVLEAKEMLRENKHFGVTDVVKVVGISRSTYYKYAEHVFALNDGVHGKRVTISLLLTHESGVLSSFLKTIADRKGNILTISQDSPISGKAHASVTFDITDIIIPFDQLIEELRTLTGVAHLELIGIE